MLQKNDDTAVVAVTATAATDYIKSIFKLSWSITQYDYPIFNERRVHIMFFSSQRCFYCCILSNIILNANHLMNSSIDLPSHIEWWKQPSNMSPLLLSFSLQLLCIEKRYNGSSSRLHGTNIIWSGLLLLVMMALISTSLMNLPLQKWVRNIGKTWNLLPDWNRHWCHWQIAIEWV